MAESTDYAVRVAPNNVAVTALAFAPAAGNFNAGTTATVYGLA